MSLRVAVDFGTSSTCVVASIYGREPQVVMIDGHPLLPSSVFCAEDGTLFVGLEAERQAAVDPSRYEPNPKRRIDEGELLLGTSVVSVLDAVRAVLERAIAEARRVGGGVEVDVLVLTHPADWGVMRTRVLRQAAAGLAKEIALVPEPVAAALFHAATFTPTGSERTVEYSSATGDVLAVLDMGGGTVDVSVVRKENSAGSQAGYRVLATKGDPSFGGADIDQALLELVGAQVADADPEAWRALMEARTLPDRRRRRVLRQDVRGAKETLSRHAYTDVPMPPPFADAHVTREDLERLIAGPLGRAVAMTSVAIEEAGLRPKQLTGIFLVGGSSRIPMVARLVHERLGIVPITLDQPETVVARGAMRTALPRPRPGTPKPAAQPQSSGPRRPPTPSSGIPGGHTPPGVVRPAPAPSGFAPGYRPVGQPATALAAPDRPGRNTKKLLGIGGVLVLVAAAVVGTILLLNQQSTPGSDGPKQISAFGYRFSYPADWKQSDTVQQDKQVAIRPADALDGPDFVSVQRFDLGYDFEDERERFLTELQTRLDESGRDITKFNPDDKFAGRDVITYIETGEGTATVWLVIAKDERQLSIGCQWAGDGRERVEKTCEQVVRTVQITG
jgi:type VII secretion-associated protein (TIGR03931 family)